MKKKLMVIDDEAPFTRILKLLLEETDEYEVCVENDGNRALEAARRFAPDLVLMDVVMPEVDGGALAASFREDLILRNVPIVYLTAIISKEEMKGESGVVGGRVFIPKPVNKKTLIDVIERELARVRGGGAPA